MTANRFDTCTSLEEVVLQAMGFASVCWVEIENAGRFLPEECKAAGDEAIARIREILTTPNPGIGQAAADMAGPRLDTDPRSLNQPGWPGYVG